MDIVCEAGWLAGWRLVVAVTVPTVRILGSVILGVSDQRLTGTDQAVTWVPCDWGARAGTRDWLTRVWLLIYVCSQLVIMSLQVMC